MEESRLSMFPTPEANASEAIADRLSALVHELCSSPRTLGDPKGLWKTSSWIARQFKAASGGSMAVRLFTQPYNAIGAAYRNIILRIGPEPSPDRPLTILGAHYDTFPSSPGADDNASSVAVLIEAARLLAPIAESLSFPIEIVAWACEEPPAFGNGAMGSSRHHNFLRREGVPVARAIILEMVGYYSDIQSTRKLSYQDAGGAPRTATMPEKGDFLLVVGTDRKGIENIGDYFGGSSLKTFSVPGYSPLLDWCDGVNWADSPRILLTSTGMLRNPNYHRAGDLPSTLDYKRMATLSEGIAGFLTTVRD